MIKRAGMGLALAVVLGFSALGSTAESSASLFEPRQAKSCGWDKRDGWISNSRKCRKALVVYRAQVRREGVFDPYGAGCRFARKAKIWRCSAGKYRTTNIEEGDFSRGYVYRKGGRLVAVVTYPVNPF